MCGIIGYTGNKKCLPILMEGLRTLEYRGYDSAGITVARDGELFTVKAQGRLSELEKRIAESDVPDGFCGIGHTRWATHGEPSDVNSHPHTTDRLTLVHNGIIENYAEIEELLAGAGYDFVSQTDTERAAKLIDMFYSRDAEPIGAIKHAMRVIRGSYAFGIVFADRADTVYAVRKDSPLVVAHDGEGGYIASDVTALLPYTSEYYSPEEGIITVVKGNAVSFCDTDGNAVSQNLIKADWSVEQSQRGGFAHFMKKEIHEEPHAVRRTVDPRILDGLPVFGIDMLDGGVLGSVSRIHVVACGTAMHAGLVGRHVVERLARVPVSVEIASEFRYRDPILEKGELAIFLSQSGETADTLAALRHAKQKGVYTLAIVNVIGSSVAREADGVLYTWAGPEIAVASTKAYTVQCALLYMLAVKIALAKNEINQRKAKEICELMGQQLPKLIEQTLLLDEKIRGVASELVAAEHMFYIGRDIDSALCAEASLKLKEISYIHSEAYAAGELKHGTISLITSGTPVVAVLTASAVCEKTVSGIREVKARGAKVICVCSEEISERLEIPCDELIVLPKSDELLAPFAAATAMQLLAYHVSALKGLDVDKPRNLAKSVTVE